MAIFTPRCTVFQFFYPFHELSYHKKDVRDEYPLSMGRERDQNRLGCDGHSQESNAIVEFTNLPTFRHLNRGIKKSRQARENLLGRKINGAFPIHQDGVKGQRRPRKCQKRLLTPPKVEV